MSTTNLNPASGAIVLTGFSKQAIELVRRAEDMGWTFQRTTHGAQGRAPDGTSTISIGRKLTGHGRAYQNSVAVLRRWERQHPVDEYSDEMGERIVTGAAVVTERPWRTSTRVIQRLWDNDTVDYACAYDGCTFTHENPRAVAGHFGQIHTYMATHPKDKEQPTFPQSNGASPVDAAVGIAARNTPIPVTITVGENDRIEEVRLGHTVKPDPGNEPTEVMARIEDGVLTVLGDDPETPAEAAVEAAVEEPLIEEEPVEAITTAIAAKMQPSLVADVTEDEATSDADALDMIRRIVAAPLLAEINSLRADCDKLMGLLEQVEGERDALATKLAGRSRDLAALRGLIDELGADDE